MNSIEPHFQWRELYAAEEDKQSPFYGRTYSEFHYSNMLYNFYLHPQWDSFGSSTLYGKILFVDYDDHFALIELIGEWNDALHNDIMILKRNLLEPMIDKGIYKFVLFCDNVLNFHSSDDDYYAELAEELNEEGGWLVCINTRQHLLEEMQAARLQQYIHFGAQFNDYFWRAQKPLVAFQIIEALIEGRIRELPHSSTI